MARGLKLHLKRLAAPKTWMLQKLGGTWAPRPSTGPHKLRECMPLVVLLRNRLKYALNRKEVQDIVYSRLVKVDGKTRTDTNYPVGFMDVVSLEKVNQHFRILYDHKGRFAVQRISAEEAAYKICRVRRVQLGAKSVPYLATHDARTIRFPDPDIKVNDSVLVDIASGKIRDFARFEVGNVAMVTGGRSMGRVGLIHRIELHEGTHQICHLRDSNGQDFATRLSNVFVIGRGDKPWVTLPSHKGLLVSVLKEYEQRHNVVLHA